MTKSPSSLLPKPVTFKKLLCWGEQTKWQKFFLKLDMHDGHLPSPNVAAISKFFSNWITCSALQHNKLLSVRNKNKHIYSKQ